MIDHTLEIGTILNERYQIQKVLKQGGFGITYLVRDEVLKQYVVLKEYFPMQFVSRAPSGQILWNGADDKAHYLKEGRERFLNEAKILASIFGIPGIVKVLGYFEQNDTAYMVMEYVEGVTLRKYLEQSEEIFSFEDALKMLRPILDALQQVHKKNLFHRDLTPDNIMVDQAGQMKLLDFGSARHYFLEKEREKTLTVLVKDGYAPLEQYDRKGNQGPWSDIYSFFAIIYEILTGAIPQTATNRRISDTLYPPSAYGVLIQADEEEKLMKKGLAIDVKERYQSVKEVLEDFFPEEKEKKVQRLKSHQYIRCLGIGLILVCVGAFWLFSQGLNKESQLKHAGSFVRGSTEYEEFLAFVKENALDQTQEEAYNSPILTTVYTIDEEAVQTINMPSNCILFEKTVDEVFDLAKSQADLQHIRQDYSFKVYDYGYGAIETLFICFDTYTVNGNIELMIGYDYHSKYCSSIRIKAINGTDGDYLAFAANLLSDFVKSYTTKETLYEEFENMWDGLYENDPEKSNNWVTLLAYPLFETRIYWDEAYEKPVLRCMPQRSSFTSGKRPTYNWP